MARSMQHLQRERAEANPVALFEQDVRFPLHQWGAAPEHARSQLIRIHRYIGGMDSQGYRIDRADSIDGADVVDMTVRINDIFGYKLQFPNGAQYLLRLISRIDNDRLMCLWAGIQVAVLLERANGDAGDNRHLLLRFFCFRHTIFSF